MISTEVALSLVSFIVVMGTWGMYFSGVPALKVPVRPTGSILSQYLGIGLGISAIFLSYRESGSVSLAVIIPAVFALMMGTFFLWLLTQRKTPIGDLKVKVGDQLLPFSARTSEGVAFNSDELLGKRILLKFFRGGW